ncbi:MAG: hypothetical protein P1V81_09090 [Planctomycetota bacterium]|nr:hypothetical protein [Planctomycetota bacterium]
MSLHEIAVCSSPTPAAWTLWVGPGVRPDLAERILAGPGLQGHARLQRDLTDLADLLAGDAGPGRLVATVGEIPLEDIGILRRFLERDPGRELVLLTDRDEPAPGSLLCLPRTRLFPRPLSPALIAYLGTLPEQPEVNTVIEPTPPTTGLEEHPEHERLLLAWQVLRDRLAARDELSPLLSRLEVELERSLPIEADPGPEADARVDLGVLAEELLAGLSLERNRRMRFLFRPEGELSVRGNKPDLERCLGSLFDLVGRCSSPDSVIRVRVTSTSGSEADPDAPVDTTVEFPDSPLVGVPMGSELDPETIAAHFGPDVSAALRGLIEAAHTLGAELGSLPARPGRRLVRLRLPRLLGAERSSATLG